MAKEIVITSGRRKQAVARATLKPGKGIVRINHMKLEDYQPQVARMRIMEPLMLAGDAASKINIDVNVSSGGWSAGADAVRLAIARGMVEFTGSKSLKQTYLDYDRQLLVADVRRNEPHKPNDSKPRAKRQKSYR